MADFDVKKIRGLKSLLQDAVVNGAKSIQQVHLGTTARTFRVLEQIPVVSTPSVIVRAVHDAIVTTGYAATQAVTEAIGTGIDLALDAVEGPAAGATEEPRNTPSDG